ncbi:unnamed protein product (macronuclear) [Paramecium tetraurelia]|uniref:FHA domain-containing protein n=1 Tax=Paramecium tetraurelia TaxID=5888 RepID=A0BT57_PARTE|nr:uncharacterized protein GSPATT00031956001 [Paramecium tetraurelia]CAK61724.1 unnamed protein product [Paramecium tetraurelia]|eukprot:XP_001429122.1 hypothetical protein (macronuclear) [Paramecium tetraurelia strain d4-2]
MNLTQLESIFQQLNSQKTPPSQWTIDQIRNFCDHYKLEWAKEILRIHNNKQLNVDHLLINNVLGAKQKRHHEKVQDKISILEAQGLQNDVIKEILFGKSILLSKLQRQKHSLSNHQIENMVIHSSIFMRPIVFHLKDYKDCIEVEFVHEENVVGVLDLKENEILQQITCYTKQIFMADKTIEHRRNNDIYIKSNLIKLLFTNLQYLPKESPLFWDVEQVSVLLKIIKLNCLDELFKQNLIDGFVISVLGKCPFTETSQLLKLFNFDLQHNTKIQNVRLQTHSKLTQLQKYTYIQNVFLTLFYLANTLNQTIYNCLEIDQFQTEGQQISHFDYYDLFYFNVKCPQVWKKSPDKKAQTSDDLETFKVFNLEDGRHESIAIDAFRSNSVGVQHHVKNNEDLQKIQKANSGIESSVRQRQDLMYCQKELEYKAQDTSSENCITNETTTTQGTPLIDSAKNTADSQKPMQESVYFPQKQELQGSVYFSNPEQQQQMQESVYFIQQDIKPMQESVYFSQTQGQQQQMQESVIFPQKEQVQMQESVCFIPQKQQMQESVYFPQQEQQAQKMEGSVYFSNQMQGSVAFPGNQNQQMQQSVMLQDPKSNSLGQSEMVGQSIMMGQSTFTNNNINNTSNNKPNIKSNPDPMGQSINIEQIIQEVQYPQDKKKQQKSVKLKVSFQEGDEKKKGEIQNRTPTRQKRIKLITSIEQASLQSVITNPFILNVSHQMKIKSEQFHKILLINLIGATFGRSQDNQYVLQDQSKISSKHARITVVNDRFHLQDLGSKRGTFLNANKMRIKKAMVFYIGDKQAFQILEVNEIEGTLTFAFDKELIDTKQVNLKIGETWSIGRDLKRTHYQFIGYPIHQLLSQIHCIISYVSKDGEPKFIIDDQNSKNGTWLRLSDKKLLSEPQLLLRNSKFNLAFEIQYEVIDVYYQNNQ